MDVILEGDALTIVKAIESSVPIQYMFGQIIDDIRVVLDSRRSWRVCHTKRGANGAAHGLAKEAIHGVGDRIWMEETPLPCISHIVNLELLLFLCRVKTLVILFFFGIKFNLFSKKKKKKKSQSNLRACLELNCRR
jgi:hypothetical protein